MCLLWLCLFYLLKVLNSAEGGTQVCVCVRAGAAAWQRQRHPRQRPLPSA